MAKKNRTVFSEKVDLIEKSKEAALAAVQIFNNPLITFRSESFIVLFMIAWTYLLHAHYRASGVDYRYYKKINNRRKYLKTADGSIKHWDLNECISRNNCPLDRDTVNNLFFLIGLRNQIEHRKASGLDSYLSARYQACALNFNSYLKKLHGEKYGLDRNLALSLQFSELDYSQSKTIKDKEGLIPQNVISYIAGFDNKLSEKEIKSERFAYRLLFAKVLAKRKGQADHVLEFIDPKSNLAKNISKEYWIKEETEKQKFSATLVIQKVRESGFNNFSMYQHTLFWRKHDGKNPNKGFGTMVVKTWYWYQNWIDYIISEKNKRGKVPF